jgi:hypothetical protein
MNKTSDPVSTDYVPFYEDDTEECERLYRCLQQQIEDCFTTISRIQDRTEDKPEWKMIREGLRFFRVGLRTLAK